MTRKTKTLSGASQDAYFRRVLKTYPAISEEARDHLVRQLRSEIAQVRIRPAHRETADAAKSERIEGGRQASSPPRPEHDEKQSALSAPPPAGPFDPFALNVVVFVRTKGRQAALDALNAIDSAENLKALAREQQLGIDPELASPHDLSAAIVAAAERRIANRRAAAGRS